MDNNLKIPQKAKKVTEILQNAGFEAYFVGGCVRDSCLGKTPDDWDICTDARPEEVTNLFRKIAEAMTDEIENTKTAASETMTISVAETGLKHGTVTVVVDHEPFEVTTYRTEGTYSDHRRPDRVDFTPNLAEDLKRRDFTINALAYSEKTGLKDLHGGREDLAAGLIRCIGDPRERFNEDALRIMRCLRFASQLGFNIHKDTAAAVHNMKAQLHYVAAERIRSELVKLLTGPGAADVMREYRDVIAEIIPELAAAFDCDQQNDFHIYDVWEHILHVVDQIPATPLLRLAALFHDIGKPPCKTVTPEGWGHFYHHEHTGAKMTDEIMKRLKFDNNTRTVVVELVDRHGIVFDPDGKQAGRLLLKLGEERLRQLIELERADVKSQAPMYVEERLKRIAAFEKKVDLVLQEQACLSLKDLAVNGKDVMAAGIPQGEQVGAILRRLLEAVAEGEIPNERGLLLEKINKSLGT